MKIPSLPHLYRNLRRGTEILSVLSKYGLADWIDRLNIEFARDQFKDRAEGTAIARQPPETRIRLALTELGPTFIKFGQLLSTRPDLVGVQLAEELKKLRDQIPPDSPERVRQTVEQELGRPIEELFDEFELKAAASASIGQVHRAVLKTGEVVAVKVQRHGIERIVAEDLDVMTGLAQLAQRIPEFTPYRPVETVSEIGRMLRRELDFGSEERNLLQFHARYRDEPHVRIPRPYTDYCTPHVLTMEWLDGISLGDVERLKGEGVDLELVAERGAAIYMRMVFEEGLFHADPHPANLLVLPDNTIGLLDFGMVGRIDESLRREMERLVQAIVGNDPSLLKNVIKRVGQIPDDLDDSALTRELAEFVDTYGTMRVGEIDLARILSDMVEIIRRYRITLPSQVALLIKVLITLEGTARNLAPQFNLIDVLERYQRRQWIKRFSPRYQWRRARRLYFETERMLEIAPRKVIDILEAVQAGKFDVHLDHRGLEPSVNRLVVGMLASALFLGSSWILAAKVPPLLFTTHSLWGMKDLSLLGLAGCLASFFLGWRLLRAIAQSGRLGR